MNQQTIFAEHYEILARLGEGSFGCVFRARQLGLDRTVALKVLNAINEDSWLRFEREAKILTGLRHRNLVQVYGYGICESKPYMAMEFVDGTELEKTLEQGPLAPDQAIEVIRQASAGIGLAHAQGIVHRDLKPSNIILQEFANGTGGVVKVIDFGLAKLLPASGQKAQQLTGVGLTVGSVAYMSPEQCTAGDIDQRSDIYSLGCILYHCLTGDPPFESDNLKVLMARHVSEAVPPLPKTLPEPLRTQLDDVIEKSTRKNRQDRYQSAQELIDDLDRITAVIAEPVKKKTASKVPSNSAIPKVAADLTNKLFAPLTGILLILVCAIAGFIFYNKGIGTAPPSDLSGFPNSAIMIQCDYMQYCSPSDFDISYPKLIQKAQALGEADRMQVKLCFAERLLDLGKFENAIKYIEQLISQSTNPNDRIRLYVADARSRRNSGEEMLAYNKSVNESAKGANLTPFSRLALSLALVETHDWPKAREILQQFENVPRTSPWYLYIRMRVLVRLCQLEALTGKKQDALMHANELLALIDSFPHLKETAPGMLGPITQRSFVGDRCPEVGYLITKYIDRHCIAPPSMEELRHSLLFGEEPVVNDVTARRWFQQADEFVLNEGPKKADREAVCRRVLARPDADLYPPQQAHLLIFLADIEAGLGHNEAAYDLFKKAVTIACDHDLVINKQLTNSVYPLYDHMQYKLALVVTKELMREVRRDKDKRQILLIGLAYGDVLATYNRIIAADMIYEEALRANTSIDIYTWQLVVRRIACSPEGIAHLVDEIYVMCLGRHHTRNDKDYEKYTAQMIEGVPTQEIAAQLFASKEFGSGKSDAQFVASLFQAASDPVNPKPAETEINSYLRALSAGASRRNAADRFVNSPYFARFLITRCYREILTRSGEGEGEFWRPDGKLRQPFLLERTLFSTCLELASTHRGRTRQMIEHTYHVLLGRQPTESELKEAQPKCDRFIHYMLGPEAPAWHS